MPIAFERMRVAHTEKKDRNILGTQPRIKSADCAARCARSLLHPFLAGLVVFAERLNPIPSRTRPLNFPAPMVLSLKAWKSRSLPGLPRTDFPRHDDRIQNGRQKWRPFFMASG